MMLRTYVPNRHRNTGASSSRTPEKKSSHSPACVSGNQYHASVIFTNESQNVFVILQILMILLPFETIWKSPDATCGHRISNGTVSNSNMSSSLINRTRNILLLPGGTLPQTANGSRNTWFLPSVFRHRFKAKSHFILRGNSSAPSFSELPALPFTLLSFPFIRQNQSWNHLTSSES